MRRISVCINHGVRQRLTDRIFSREGLGVGIAVVEFELIAPAGLHGQCAVLAQLGLGVGVVLCVVPINEALWHIGTGKVVGENVARDGVGHTIFGEGRRCVIIRCRPIVPEGQGTTKIDRCRGFIAVAITDGRGQGDEVGCA